MATTGVQSQRTRTPLYGSYGSGFVRVDWEKQTAKNPDCTICLMARVNLSTTHGGKFLPQSAGPNSHRATAHFDFFVLFSLLAEAVGKVYGDRALLFVELCNAPASTHVTELRFRLEICDPTGSVSDTFLARTLATGNGLASSPDFAVAMQAVGEGHTTDHLMESDNEGEEANDEENPLPHNGDGGDASDGGNADYLAALKALRAEPIRKRIKMVVSELYVSKVLRDFLVGAHLDGYGFGNGKGGKGKGKGRGRGYGKGNGGGTQQRGGRGTGRGGGDSGDGDQDTPTSLPSEQFVEVSSSAWTRFATMLLFCRPDVLVNVVGDAAGIAANATFDDVFEMAGGGHANVLRLIHTHEWSMKDAHLGRAFDVISLFDLTDVFFTSLSAPESEVGPVVDQCYYEPNNYHPKQEMTESGEFKQRLGDVVRESPSPDIDPEWSWLYKDLNYLPSVFVIPAVMSNGLRKEDDVVPMFPLTVLENMKRGDESLVTQKRRQQSTLTTTNKSGAVVFRNSFKLHRTNEKLLNKIRDTTPSLFNENIDLHITTATLLGGTAFGPKCYSGIQENANVFDVDKDSNVISADLYTTEIRKKMYPLIQRCEDYVQPGVTQNQCPLDRRGMVASYVLRRQQELIMNEVIRHNQGTDAISPVKEILVAYLENHFHPMCVSLDDISEQFREQFGGCPVEIPASPLRKNKLLPRLSMESFFFSWDYHMDQILGTWSPENSFVNLMILFSIWSAQQIKEGCNAGLYLEGQPGAGKSYMLKSTESLCVNGSVEAGGQTDTVAGMLDETKTRVTEFTVFHEVPDAMLAGTFSKQQLEIMKQACTNENQSRALCVKDKDGNNVKIKIMFCIRKTFCVAKNQGTLDPAIDNRLDRVCVSERKRPKEAPGQVEETHPAYAAAHGSRQRMTSRIQAFISVFDDAVNAGAIAPQNFHVYNVLQPLLVNALKKCCPAFKFNGRTFERLRARMSACQLGARFFFETNTVIGKLVEGSPTQLLSVSRGLQGVPDLIHTVAAQAQITTQTFIYVATMLFNIERSNNYFAVQNALRSFFDSEFRSASKVLPCYVTNLYRDADAAADENERRRKTQSVGFQRNGDIGEGEFTVTSSKIHPSELIFPESFGNRRVLQMPVRRLAGAVEQFTRKSGSTKPMNATEVTNFLNKANKRATPAPLQKGEFETQGQSLFKGMNSAEFKAKFPGTGLTNLAYVHSYLDTSSTHKRTVSLYSVLVTLPDGPFKMDQDLMQTLCVVGRGLIERRAADNAPNSPNSPNSKKDNGSKKHTNQKSKRPRPDNDSDNVSTGSSTPRNSKQRRKTATSLVDADVEGHASRLNMSTLLQVLQGRPCAVFELYADALSQEFAIISAKNDTSTSPLLRKICAQMDVLYRLQYQLGKCWDQAVACFTGALGAIDDAILFSKGFPAPFMQANDKDGDIEHLKHEGLAVSYKVASTYVFKSGIPGHLEVFYPLFQTLEFPPASLQAAASVIAACKMQKAYAQAGYNWTKVPDKVLRQVHSTLCPPTVTKCTDEPLVEFDNDQKTTTIEISDGLFQLTGKEAQQEDAYSNDSEAYAEFLSHFRHAATSKDAVYALPVSDPDSRFMSVRYFSLDPNPSVRIRSTNTAISEQSQRIAENRVLETGEELTAKHNTSYNHGPDDLSPDDYAAYQQWMAQGGGIVQGPRPGDDNPTNQHMYDYLTAMKAKIDLQHDLMKQNKTFDCVHDKRPIAPIAGLRLPHHFAGVPGVPGDRSVDVEHATVINSVDGVNYSLYEVYTDELVKQALQSHREFGSESTSVDELCEDATSLYLFTSSAPSSVTQVSQRDETFLRVTSNLPELIDTVDFCHWFPVILPRSERQQENEDELKRHTGTTNNAHTAYCLVLGNLQERDLTTALENLMGNSLESEEHQDASSTPLEEPYGARVIKDVVPRCVSATKQVFDLLCRENEVCTLATEDARDSAVQLNQIAEAATRKPGTFSTDEQELAFIIFSDSEWSTEKQDRMELVCETRIIARSVEGNAQYHLERLRRQLPRSVHPIADANQAHEQHLKELNATSSKFGVNWRLGSHVPPERWGDWRGGVWQLLPPGQKT
jgi:hypothetical protein